MDQTRTLDDVDGRQGEYTGRRRSERSRRSRHADGQARRRVRILYFSLASLWGFFVGALATALALTGPFSGSATTLPFFLVAGIGLALFGGAVTASIYREARKRTVSSGGART